MKYFWTSLLGIFLLSASSFGQLQLNPPANSPTGGNVMPEQDGGTFSSSCRDNGRCASFQGRLVDPGNSKKFKLKGEKPSISTTPDAVQ